jgi:hypothetical protein
VFHCTRNSYSVGELGDGCKGGGYGATGNWRTGALFTWRAVELMELRTVGLYN